MTTITGKISDATDMLTAAKTDGKFTIANKLDASKTIDVEVVTTVPTAAAVSKSSSDTGLNSFTGTTATLYNAANQSITLTTDVLTTLAAKSDADILSLSSGKNTEHTITLTAAQALPLAATPTLTFTTEDGQTTEITVELTAPAITALTSSNFAEGTGSNTFEDATTTSGNAKVTMPDPTTNSKFTLTVSSKEGFTIDDTTSDWLKVETENTSETSGSYTTTVTVGIVDGTDLSTAIDDGKIVLKNKITGGGDMTIDVVTTVTPTP